MAPKLDRLYRSEIAGNYALRPPSPVLTMESKAQRKSDEKAASKLSVIRVLVDYSLAIKARPQQNPEYALLQKEPLTLNLPKTDMRNQWVN